MNLILLFSADFVDVDRVRLAGRRAKHVATVHRASVGDTLTVGIAGGITGGLIDGTPGGITGGLIEGTPGGPVGSTVGGMLGRGTVISLDRNHLELLVSFDTPPPPPIGITLILALPRPKVLNRVLAGAASMGIKRLVLINAWRVEKSYWSSPRLAEENLREQAILGLEQARDTMLPRIETRRLFRPFVEDELPAITRGTLPLVAHPYDAKPVPRDVLEEVTLAVGPEGGFIEKEIASLEAAGFRRITSGPRILRVETAVPLLVGALKPLI